jgi:hypothetical protein
MWMFITVAHGANDDEVAEIMAACRKYVQQDGGTDSSMNVSIYDDTRQLRWKETYMLPFLPIAQIFTTGPGAGGIERKSTYYLARNEDGQIVRKLVSPKIIKAGSNVKPEATAGQSSGASGNKGGVAKRNASGKRARRG